MAVTIALNEKIGKVITPSEKSPGFGSFRVDSEIISWENGFMNKQKRSAFIRGEIALLEESNLKEGQTIPGQIIKYEGFSPAYDGHKPKINPSTGEVCLTEGKETFLQWEYTNNMEAYDVWVGGDSVKLSEEAQKALSQQEI